MCGINGIFDPAGAVDERSLVAMRDTLTHRGPDDAGIFMSSDRTVGLGHRRLSIIDLSPNGHQPMCNEDETIWLVYNGEIYNFQQLRQVLKQAGHTFRSKTDSEVVVHAYEEWGPDCVQRFRGMFAFALWDAPKRRLMLARDRMGIKPLFYSQLDGRLTFASEIKALVADTNSSLTIDNTAIYDFFTYGYVPTPKSIYKEINKLPPACIAILEAGKFTVQEYWEPEFRVDKTLSDKDATATVLDKLREAIDLHMISDVPVGVLLSGGLDSSTIAALAATGDHGLAHTYTIGFDVEEHDETRYARVVADRYGTAHKELQLAYANAQAVKDKVIDLYDEPFADSSAIPTLSVCEMARKDVKVALSGEGGDEIFGGYTRYSDWLRFSKLDFIPMALRKILIGLPADILPQGFKGKWSLQAMALSPVDRYAELLTSSFKADKSRYFSAEFLKQFEDYDDFWYLRKYWRDDLDPMSRMQYVDLKTYLHDDILTKMDRASMAVSLEARVPLLDHELVETVTSLPVHVRNRGNEKKRVMKMAMRDYLPAELINRRKQGFSAPLYAWLDSKERQTVRPVYDSVFDPAKLDQPGVVNRSNVWRLTVMNSWLCKHA